MSWDCFSFLSKRLGRSIAIATKNTFVAFDFSGYCCVRTIQPSAYFPKRETGLEQIEETHSLTLIKMIVGHRWLLGSEVCGEPQNTRIASDVLLCLQVVHLDVEFTKGTHEKGKRGKEKGDTH